MAIRLDLCVSAPQMFRQGFRRQTTNNQHVQDQRKFRAVRYASSTTTRTRTAMIAELPTVRAQMGDSHPNNPDLMLSYLEGVLHKGDPAYYRAIYEPRNREGYEITANYISVQWMKDVNGVDIPLTENDGFRIRRVPVWTIRFVHEFYQLPIPPVHSDSVETVNIGNVTISNVGTFTPKQLLYSFPEAQQIVAGATSLWRVLFTIIARKDTWIEHVRDASGAVVVRDMYPSASFPTIP